ncbi:Serine/threonine-protein kinase ATG1 [Ceratocystis fimbriata CBS 114723]|uniref:non-specific serine/threonine protein kinase n=1 Tax=Ceratocystis fimbriata CBS 114723 TaxID=1035309 RepID=A0A2C5X6E7_9PEZI|nr:Serine/threonine-protein kinase ATG1 [Ceratocystis fimbriata CBS 114723]
MESSSRMSESEQNIAPFHHGTYHMLAEIGKGSFARVMKARHADSGQIFAIKMVKKKRLNNKLTANLQTEIQIMKNTRHPGIIRLYESYDTEGHVNLVMEYCKLGDMSRIIKHAGKLSTIPGLQEMDRRHHSYPKALNPMIVRLFARQLIDAIRFLHRRNLIHRDIKPQNILLDIEDVSNMSSERQVVLESLAKAIGVNVNAWRWLPLVKLADFGFARHLPSTSLAETLCGSPLYMGPEILRYERYDAKADLWSLGAVVFEMLTGKPPFRAKNHIELLRRIDTTVLEFPKPAINYPDGSDYPKDLQRFILGLLKKTPVERMSFETAFNHDAMVCTLEDLALEDSPSGAPTLTRRPGSARLSDGGNSLSRPGSSKSIRSVFQSSTHIHSPKRSNTTDGVNLNAPEASRRPPKRTATINDDGFTHTPVTSARSPSSSAFDPTVVQQTSSRSSIRGAANGLGIQGHSQNMGAASPRTRGTTSTEMTRAIEDALSPGVVPMSKSPSHSSVKGQKPKLASHKVGSEMAFERDYVVVEKKQVEVNAMADEMAASPQGHDKNQLIRRSQSSTAVNIPGRSSHGNNRNSMDLTPPASRSPSSISRAIQGATMRFFGVRFSPNRIVRGQSPPMYNPYPVGYTPPAAPGLITDGRNSGESQYNETRVAQMIEDYANRSDCIWSFAEIKFQQLMPESASSDVGSNSSKLADELSDLTDDAIVILSEEALLLYVKALGILATAIDFASQWWLRHSRLGDGPPHTTDRINATVQWLRNRFNDTLEKVEHVRLRLIQAQERLPEDHPAHPSHHAEDGAMSIGSGNLNVYISSRITADKLIYDRALEMCKHAAGDEMCKRNLSVCETYYSTALRMMEALLDRTDDNRSTNSEGGDGEFDQQQEEDQQHLEKMIHAIRGRLLATQQKMQSINENEKLYRAGAHRRSGSNTPVSVVSN